MLYKKKYYYIFKLKYTLLNNKYLCFYKNYNNTLKTICKKHNLGLIRLQSTIFKKLFTYKNKNLCLYTLIYFNNYNNFIVLQNNINIKKNSNFVISYLGHFINNKINNKITNYYFFFKKNLKLYIFIIYLHINNFKIILFNITFKIIYITNKIYLKKKNIIY
jgi:hypothetical protein